MVTMETSRSSCVNSRRSADGVVHIAVGGELDCVSAWAVRAAVDDAYALAAARVELDLSEVTFCSCDGLRMVFPAQPAGRAGDLRLVSFSAPVGRIVRLLRDD